MRVLLILRGYYPSTDPSVVGEFRYLPEFDAYVWRGAPISVEEFNDTFNEWIRKQTTVRAASSLDIRIISGQTQGALEAAPAHTLSEDGAIPSPASPATAELLDAAAEATPKKRRKKSE